MKAEIMTEFETMRADLEAELAEARERVAETAADAAAADAARLDAVAVRDAMQLAVGPLARRLARRSRCAWPTNRAPWPKPREMPRAPNCSPSLHAHAL